MSEALPTIGFITPPIWFEPSLTEFPSVIKESVRVQQAPLLFPDFDYHLESIASVETQEQMNLCARSLQTMECDLVAQVGTPFSWSLARSEEQARARASAMEAASGIPCLMMGLSIVDGLRALNVRNIAVDCTYYEREWRDGFAGFLSSCGFSIEHVSTLSDQGLTAPDSKMEDYGWSMTDELAIQSILHVANSAPDAEAIVVTGAGTRTLSILKSMEERIGRPIVAADTILYWAIARRLGLTLTSQMGLIASQ